MTKRLMSKLVYSLKSNAFRRGLRWVLVPIIIGAPLLAVFNGAIQSLALLCYMVLTVLDSDNNDKALWMAPRFLIVGIAFSVIMLPLVQILADGFFTIGIALIVCFLFVWITRRFRRMLPAAHITDGLMGRLDAWLRAAAAWRAAYAGTAGASGAHVSLPLSPILIAAGVSLIIAAASGLLGSPWHLTGSGIGSSIWNAHYLGAALQRAGNRLADGSIVGTGGLPAYIAIPDVPVLDAVKFLHPTAMGGVALTNIISVLCTWSFLLGATLLLETWNPNRYACALAGLLFLLQPLGYSIRIGAPFDLLASIFILVLAVRRNVPAIVLIGAAFLSGFLNIASGYELAVLAVLMWAFGYIKSGTLAVSIAAAGIASSILFADLIHAMAPAINLREVWWSSGELGRMLRTGEVSYFYLGVGLVVVAAIGGIVRMVRLGVIRELSFVIALFVTGGILAIPSRLGGVPLLLPSDLLDRITPMGWPSARLFELCIFALAIPMSFAAAAVLDFLWVALRRPRPLRALGWLLSALVLVAMLPRATQFVVPPTPPGASTVIFPIAEAGSNASLLESGALLQNAARILQPMPYVNVSPFYPGEAPNSPATIAKLRRFGVHTVVVLYFLYAEPDRLSVAPGLFDPRDYVEPALASNPNFQIQEVGANTEVYEVYRVIRVRKLGESYGSLFSAK